MSHPAPSSNFQTAIDALLEKKQAVDEQNEKNQELLKNLMSELKSYRDKQSLKTEVFWKPAKTLTVTTSFNTTAR